MMMSFDRRDRALKPDRHLQLLTRNRSGVVSCSLIAIVMAALAPAYGEERSAERIPIAIADLDYVDTSGEMRNQQAEHEVRLRAFINALRVDLDGEGHYRTITLECAQPLCTAGSKAGPDLVESARAAGARLLLFGGIHKMSTLVQYAKVLVIDLHANKLVYDRLISFRGDSDESWQRAERFLSNDLRSANTLSP